MRLSIPFFVMTISANHFTAPASQRGNPVPSMTNRLISATGVLACLALAGCQSDNPRNARAGSTGDAPMTASGELATPDPKPMDAQAAFFGGKIQAEAMLAKSDAPWKTPSGSDTERASSGERNGGGGFTGGFGGIGGGRRGGGRRGGGGEPSTQAGSDAPRQGAPTMRASNAPPVQLRLRLTNHGAQPADVEVLDFNSDLGNFVVQPEKIALPPDGTVEADPMTSRLGVPAVESIPVTVRLRVGGKSGPTETQILKLTPRAEPVPTAEPSAH